MIKVKYITNNSKEYLCISKVFPKVSCELFGKVCLLPLNFQAALVMKSNPAYIQKNCNLSSSKHTVLRD